MDIFQALLSILPRLEHLALHDQDLLSLLDVGRVRHLVCQRLAGGGLLLVHLDHLLRFVGVEAYYLWLLRVLCHLLLLLLLLWVISSPCLRVSRGLAAGHLPRISACLALPLLLLLLDLLHLLLLHLLLLLSEVHQLASQIFFVGVQNLFQNGVLCVTQFLLDSFESDLHVLVAQADDGTDHGIDDTAMRAMDLDDAA